MKSSKKRSRNKRNRPPPLSPGPAALAGGAASSSPLSEEMEDESRSLAWLIDAFSSASLDQIASAYHEAGGDAYKAAGILGAHLSDPEEGQVVEKKAPLQRKPRRVVATSGLVSGVIGKGYSNAKQVPASAKRNGSSSWDLRYSPEEGEQFLCSMLGDNSELGIGVVRDVLGECGYNVGKALDALLDISASSYIHSKDKGSDDYMKMSTDFLGTCPEIFSKNSPANIISSMQTTDRASGSTYSASKLEHEFRDYGQSHRDNATDAVDSVEQLPQNPGFVKEDLQQKVLDILFKTSDLPRYEPKSMDWKKVVQKVESFGQGLEFCPTSISDPPQNSITGKKDMYTEFRSVSRKHWDEMRDCYQKAAVAYSRGDRANATVLSEKGKYYSRLAREADDKASREIFEARNKEIKNTITIDLHGQHVKQAIGLLKLHLLLFTYIPSIHFLKVITGCGADGVGKGRLKRSVMNLVQKEHIQWSEENSGTLVLRLDGQKKYSFTECDSDSECSSLKL